MSPHLDDAALSCAALLETDEPVDILDVFTGEPDPPQRGWWDAETGFADSAESVAARRREEEAAFTGSSHHLSYLDLLEGQYLDAARGSDDAHAIGRALEAWADRNGSGTVALPAGAGRRERRFPLGEKRGSGPPQHPDHLFVRDAGLAALAGRALDLLLYEELPYRWGAPADKEVKRVAKAMGRRAQLTALPVDREAKARRVAAYASQLPHISPPGVDLTDPACYFAEERYWLLNR